MPRILDVQISRILTTLEEDNDNGNGPTEYREVILQVGIGDVVEDVTIERMTLVVGEGIYLQSSVVGVLFIPESRIYGAFVSNDTTIPFLPTLAARY